MVVPHLGERFDKAKEGFLELISLCEQGERTLKTRPNAQTSDYPIFKPFDTSRREPMVIIFR